MDIVSFSITLASILALLSFPKNFLSTGSTPTLLETQKPKGDSVYVSVDIWSLGQKGKEIARRGKDSPLQKVTPMLFLIPGE